MWLGSLATIPTGWILCDGTGGTTDMRSRHLKCSNALSELADTGGANTHTHANQAHAHTANGTHNHTATGTGHVPGANEDGGGAAPNSYLTVHGQTVTAGTTNYGNANTSANSSNNEPPYKTVAFIQFKFNVFGGFAAIMGSL